MPRQGYRFIAPVRLLQQPGNQAGTSATDLDPPGPNASASVFRHSLFFPALGITLLAVVGIVAATWIRPRSNGTLAERDLIVIADFENQTDDPVLSGALGQALLAQMGQSPYLRIASEDRIRSTLALMGREKGVRLEPDAARQVCQRLGGKAVLAGIVGMLGGR